MAGAALTKAALRPSLWPYQKTNFVIIYVMFRYVIIACWQPLAKSGCWGICESCEYDVTTRVIPIAVTHFRPVFAQRREPIKMSCVSEVCTSLFNAHTDLDTYNWRIDAGFNRQVGRSDVVMWSSLGLHGSLGEIDVRSAPSLHLGRRRRMVGAVFYYRLFMSSCLLVWRNTARIDRSVF